MGCGPDVGWPGSDALSLDLQYSSTRVVGLFVGHARILTSAGAFSSRWKLPRAARLSFAKTLNGSPLIQLGQLLDRVTQRLSIQLRVAVVHGVGGVTGELDADFLADTRVGEGGVEAVAE